ncbi:hypothetical protein SAMN05444161_6886 [Rhizobiales bacterium GAS191]|nr:hypothetical protein SAMN05444161_6886 [Rhizobiales bacterium GAS191]
MSDDQWPMPEYNAGPRDHLHAIGVISITFANLQASLDALNKSYARQLNMPGELIDFLYFNLTEEKRIEAIGTLFRASEADKAVVRAVENLLRYFKWCSKCRNNILHSELYPPSFGADPDMLHLVKKVGKQSPKSAYLKFSLPTLRLIADRMRKGVVQSAEIQLYMRFRGMPVDKVPSPYKPYAKKLPSKLNIPRPIDPSDKP